MGKRRDRRQQQASGRRVKLDLSTDDTDDAIAPSDIPSNATDTVDDNPLSLLGQYSDDEADDEDSSAKDSISNGDVQGKEPLCTSHDEQVNVEAPPLTDISIEISTNSGIETQKSPPYNGTSDPHASTCTASNLIENEWQTIFHEESGQYYYWNVQSGETTWENPSLNEAVKLVQSDNFLNPSDGLEIHDENTHNECGAPQGETVDELVNQSDTKDELPLAAHGSNNDVIAVSDDQHLVNISSGSPDVEKLDQNNHQTFGGNTDEDNHDDNQNLKVDLTVKAKCPIEECESENATARKDDIENVNIHPACEPSQCNSGMFDSVFEEWKSFLTDKGEVLKHRLGNMTGDSLKYVSRCTVMAIQLEACLNVWKTVLSLRFEAQACLSYIQNELKEMETSLARELNSQETVAPFEETKELGRQDPSVKTSANEEDVEEGEIQAFNHENHALSCDADMDVDMEVDDDLEPEPAVPGLGENLHSLNPSFSVTNAYGFSGSVDAAALVQTDATSNHYSNTWIPPLPPDDEWAPPPPGEIESVPPPPPEEPPPLPPQSPQTMQPYGVNAVPSVSHVEYYTTEYTSEYLPQTEYVAVPADYQPMMDPSVYSSYMQDASSVLYAQNAQCVETVQMEPSYMLALDPSLAYNGWSASAITTKPAVVHLPTTKPAVVHLPTTKKNSENSISTTSTDTTSVPATTSSIVEPISLEAKKAAKGKVVKKRTHSVTSAPMLNKKVSSLVNKWKQAKEELHGSDEDEEDKALYDPEALEKKKQKEIEQWRRQQIASGEALENANFQPLGTLDWRERVKRARKADKKQDNLAEESTSLSAEPQKEESGKARKPDLKELSKGLPSGWQAYWDEESREVYYGNLKTKETSWDRPVT